MLFSISKKARLPVCAVSLHHFELFKCGFCTKHSILTVPKINAKHDWTSKTRLFSPPLNLKIASVTIWRIKITYIQWIMMILTKIKVIFIGIFIGILRIWKWLLFFRWIITESTLFWCKISYEQNPLWRNIRVEENVNGSSLLLKL